MFIFRQYIDACQCMANVHYNATRRTLHRSNGRCASTRKRRVKAHCLLPSPLECWGKRHESIRLTRRSTCRTVGRQFPPSRKVILQREGEEGDRRAVFRKQASSGSHVVWLGNSPGSFREHFEQVGLDAKPPDEQMRQKEGTKDERERKEFFMQEEAFQRARFPSACWNSPLKKKKQAGRDSLVWLKLEVHLKPLLASCELKFIKLRSREDAGF